MTRPNPPPPAERAAVERYIDAAAEPARTRVRILCAAIRAEAPGAVERIAYGLPTWHQAENLIHLGAFARHVGVYPGPAAIAAFADELTAFTTSKGAIQVPHDRDLPVDLVRRLVRWRLVHVTTPPSPPATAARASSPSEAAPARAGRRATSGQDRPTPAPRRRASTAARTARPRPSRS